MIPNHQHPFTFAQNLIMAQKLQYEETLQSILGAENILITTHRSPDGDAIGSTMGLLQFITKLGKKCTVVVPDEFPEFLHWIPGTDQIIRFDTNKELVNKLVVDSDLIFSLDYNVLSRVGEEFCKVLSGLDKKMIMIDHHREPAENYNYYIHDIEASSTSQLVYDFIAYSGNKDKIDLGICEALYSGILTDTGSFRFPSTSARTHEIVGEMMEIGLEISKVYNLIYDNNSIDRLQLLGYVLGQKLSYHKDLNMAYITLSHQEMTDHNYQPGDTEGFVNYALSIKGVKFSCLMKENESGSVRMSFRSKGDFDVNKFARTYFSGGGHLNAAGGRSSIGLEATEKRLLEKAIEVLSK